MGSPRIPLGLPNTIGTPATDGTAEGSRSLAQTAMILTVNARTDVNGDEFGRVLNNIRQDR
jgi:hypothetical protein